MRVGICLQGGGAKGAFQAGVIKAIFENEQIKNNIYSISGTSIGAINGYYIYTNNVDNIGEVWTNIDENTSNNINIIHNTVDNSQVIDLLKLLNQDNKKDINYYVNYVEVNNQNVVEKIVNLKEIDTNESFEYIRYSALLPFNPQSKLSFREQFILDVKKGIYEGYKLDGGMLNNTLIKPLIEDNLDKIIIISTSKTYRLPNEIIEHNKGKIVIVNPMTEYKHTDTLNFTKEFCTKAFEEGYHVGKEIKL